jgi:YidC/Oxa1 family membrane protein insertase
VASSQYEAEYVEGMPKNRPLHLLRYTENAPPSLAITLRNAKNEPSADPEAEDVAARAAGAGVEVPLDAVIWEVVRDDQGRAVRPVSKTTTTGTVAEGQEVVFRTKVAGLGVVVTKTFRLWKGENAFAFELGFESPDASRSVVYKLLGPHGVPIEGEWFTGTFRDAVFGIPDGSGTKIHTVSAYDVAKNKDKPERLQPQPLKFAGVENQYFASFVEPNPIPKTAEEGWDAETVAVVFEDNAENRAKSDIGVEIVSKPVTVGPNVPVSHRYVVYAGAKLVEDLAPYGAEQLAAYRKYNLIPYAPEIARFVITPLLTAMYNLTYQVAKLFGGTRGNYGVAIILLTMLVRLAMFPLGRKQAMSAKKMQDLQPLMKELQDKYKDDKEELTRQTWALYKRHGVNPVSGCLPALIQMPIFVGLWQALNNSVFLRHASFLYIKNLAAPDMLFKFPFTMPKILFIDLNYYIGNYFNVLPLLVVSLMMVQTKLFSPPPTTPEAETQQKTMKFMMIFMAFMFYKVPSGLGIYFITSSLWQISERLLLPKAKGLALASGSSESDDDKTPPGGGNGGGGRGPNGTAPPAKPPGKLGQFWEKVLAEAAKNPTYRNLTEETDRPAGRDRDGGRDRDRDRDRGKPRSRPGRRR